MKEKQSKIKVVKQKNKKEKSNKVVAVKTVDKLEVNKIKKDKVKFKIKPNSILGMLSRFTKKTIVGIQAIINTLKKYIIKYKKLIILALIFILIILCIIWTKNIYLIIKYKSYTDKFTALGYNELLNNKKAIAYQKITKAEAVKIVMGTLRNDNDISGLVQSNTDTFKDENWIKAAEIYDIVQDDKINKKTYKKKEKLIEFATMLEKGKSKILEKALKEEKITLTNKSLNKLNDEEKKYIMNAIYDNIIKNNSSDLSSLNNINKGEIAKIIVNYAELNNTLHYSGKGEIETDLAKMPETYKEYPYILKEIDKSIYDMPLYNSKGTSFISPKEFYKMRKEVYEQTVSRVEEYFALILNVDYKTIDYTNFNTKINNLSLYKVNIGSSYLYQEYVKQNKIQLKGKVETYMPIMYYDCNYYRLRCKLTFEVISSDTKENLLFPDTLNGAKIEYLDNKYEMYIDVMMSRSVNSISNRIYVYPINKMETVNTDRIKDKE